jgi:hypothetical protein
MVSPRVLRTLSWNPSEKRMIDWCHRSRWGLSLTSKDKNIQKKLLRKARLPMNPVQRPWIPCARTTCLAQSIGPLNWRSEGDLCSCNWSLTRRKWILRQVNMIEWYLSKVPLAWRSGHWKKCFRVRLLSILAMGTWLCRHLVRQCHVPEVLSAGLLFQGLALSYHTEVGVVDSCATTQ